MFAGIEQDELSGFLRIFQPVSFAVGTHLVRQGQPADGAFIIESGTAEVVTVLPGDGELMKRRCTSGETPEYWTIEPLENSISRSCWPAS